MKSTLKILLLSIVWCALFLSIGIFAGWMTISIPSPWLIDPTSILYRHLRLSIVPFGALLLFYFSLIVKMQRCLDRDDTTLSKLNYYDRLLNATISTFFGVGVIWTAIGMESALMHALDGVNQGTNAVVSLGAWGLLDRLVNGGLLLALSTTVFGGVCGYLLRLLKIVLVGEKWDQFVLKETGKHEAIKAS